jgi:diphthamide synthase (EF-2-diphthine--ammonia ligase)
MKIKCGPVDDQRTVNLILPTTRPLNIAMFISGGIDSAILYYMLLQTNQEVGSIHTIVPFTVLRKEGSKHFAKPVIAYVHSCYDLPYMDPIQVGDNTLPEKEQVKSGLRDVWNLGFDRSYTGLIEQLPQHMIGWEPIPYQETHRFKAPLCHLNKSHVVDLIFKLGQSGIFHITHSCDIHELGRCRRCNGCRERQWGFDQLGLTDPGVI